MRGKMATRMWLMTGYYSPVIKARRTPQAPLTPGFMRCRLANVFHGAEIYAGALQGQA